MKVIGAGGGTGRCHRLLHFTMSWDWTLGCEDLGQSEVLGIPECEWAIQEDKLLKT